MYQSRFRHCRRARSLGLTGTASIALLLMSPVAHAQTGQQPVQPDLSAVSDPAAIQNQQDYGDTVIRSVQIGTPFTVETGRIDAGTVISTADHLAIATATGNDALSSVRLDPSMPGPATISSEQIGRGTVLATLGTLTDRAGVSIAPTGDIADSALTVENNAIESSAIGNRVANALSVVLRSAADSGDGVASAALSSADAPSMLWNYQRSGNPGVAGAATPIEAIVAGRFAITGDGRTIDSALGVTGNSQRATALANSAANEVAVASLGIDRSGATPATTTLSSLQTGLADVRASSDLKIASRGTASGALTTLSDNLNQALTAINDVDNRLESVAASGNAVLISRQSAEGRVEASATGAIGLAETGEGMSRSRLTIAGNVTIADASANRALNALAATEGSGAALTSTQTNQAAVEAVTRDRGGLAVGSHVMDSSVAIADNESTAVARGNAADNRLDLGAESVSGGTLVSSQVNGGRIAAFADAILPLNAAGPVLTNADLAISGNSVQAQAYGNIASNAVSVAGLGRPGPTMINSNQINTNAVTAQVVTPNFGVTAGQMTASSLLLTGNQFVAAATGNQATNTIISAR